MKSPLVLLLASTLLSSKVCTADSFVKDLFAFGFNGNLSWVGEKIWKLKDENNRLLQLNNLKFDEWMKTFGKEHEKISKKLPEFSETFEIIRMKIDYIDFFYDKFYVYHNASNIGTPESTPVEMANAFLSGNRTAANLAHKISEAFVLSPSSIVLNFNNNVSKRKCLNDEESSWLKLIDKYRRMIQSAVIKVYLSYRIAGQITKTHGENSTEIMTKNLEALDEEHSKMMKEYQDRTKLISSNVSKCFSLRNFYDKISAYMIDFAVRSTAIGM